MAKNKFVVLKSYLGKVQIMRFGKWPFYQYEVHADFGAGIRLTSLYKNKKQAMKSFDNHAAAIHSLHISPCVTIAYHEHF